MNTTAKTNEKLLISAMEVSELDYNTHVMDVAYEYLEKNISKDVFGINFLLASKSFWIWWSIQWDRRNRIFINETRLNEVVAIIQPDARNMIRELYMETHCVSEIHVYPNRMVMEQSYAEMIGKAFKESVKVEKGGNNATGI